MWIADLLFALVIGLLLVGLFAGLVPETRAGGWGYIALFFLVIFLASWAGGVWVGPAGPVWFGVYWMPFLMVGVIFALLFVALLPVPVEREEIVISGKEPEPVRTERAVFGTLAWVLMVVLLLTIVVRYAY